MTMRPTLVFLGFLLITFAAAGIGGLFTGPGVRDWYPSLNKPTWTPPAWLFGPVWTALYLGMAVAAFLAWRRAGFDGARWALVLFAIQLILNAAWSWMFFWMHSPLLGLVNIVPQLLIVVATIRAFWKVDKIAAWCLAPLGAWVAFATVLNFSIWWLNR